MAFEGSVERSSTDTGAAQGQVADDKVDVASNPDSATEDVAVTDTEQPQTTYESAVESWVGRNNGETPALFNEFATGSGIQEVAFVSTELPDMPALSLDETGGEEPLRAEVSLTAADFEFDQPDDSADGPAQPRQEAARLSETEVQRRAEELHEAVNRRHGGYVFGVGAHDDPDVDKIRDILDPLNAADRKAIEEAYENLEQNQDGTGLRSNLDDKLDDDEWREMEAILNRDDGRTNDAGALMVSLEHIDDDRGDAERRILEVFATLDSSRMELLEKEFKEDYGMTIDEALEEYDVSDDAMTAIRFMRKPSDQRTSEDIQDFARFAVEEENLDYLLLALRGDSPEAKQARQALQNDEEFVKDLVDAFKPKEDGGIWGAIKTAGDWALGPIDEIVGGAVRGDLTWGDVVGGLPIVDQTMAGFSAVKDAVGAQEENLQLLMAMDALKEGRVSLSTIAVNNTGSLFGWFDNKDNIDLAVENATDGEREAFGMGRELAESGREPANDTEANALDYYNRIHQAFDDSGSDREALHWEAVMLYGKDSVLAKMTGAGETHARFEALEGLSQEDWTRLRGENGEAYREDIEDFLKKFTSEEESNRLLEILDGKVNRDNQEWTFENSQGVHRTLFETIEQNEKTGFFSWGYREGNVLSGFENMTPEEAKRYRDDPQFKQLVDEFAEETLSGREEVYAEMLLKQVAETGEPPELGPREQVLKNQIDNVDPIESIAAVEALLQDESIREQLKKPHSELTEEERTLKAAINGVISEAYRDEFGIDPAYAGAGHGYYADTTQSPYQQRLEQFRESLWQDGQLSAAEKAELGLKNNDFYTQVAALPEAEQSELAEHLSEPERTLIEAIRQNPDGKMTLADRIYAATVVENGEEVTDFENELWEMRRAPDGYAQIQAMREEYGDKYGRNIDTDFLGDVDDDRRGHFRDLLTASTVDYRQTHYEQHAQALESQSGVTIDGTELTLERSLAIEGELLTDLQRMFENPEDYPPEDQEKLRQASQFFAEAIEDYRESKEAFAEKIYQAAVLIGGLSVAIATGGVAAGPLLAVALASAAGRIALKRAIQGTDYNIGDNALKDGLIGLATGGFSVLGPETIAAFRGVGAIAWGRVGSVATQRGVNVAFREGAETIAQKELTNLIGSSVSGRVSREAVEGLATRLAANPDDAARLMPVLQEVIEGTGREVTENIMRQGIPELFEQGGLRAVATELRAAAPEIARQLPGMARGLVREASVNATLGGSSNVLIESSVALANGRDLDISQLGQSFLIGAGAGATLTVAFKGALSAGAPVYGIARGVAARQLDSPAGFAASFTRGADGQIHVTAPEGTQPFVAEVRMADGSVRTIEVGPESTVLPEGAVGFGLPGGVLADVHAQVTTADGVSGNVYELHPANADGVPERAGPVDVDEGVMNPIVRPLREVTRNLSDRVMKALGLSRSADSLDFHYVNGSPVRTNEVIVLGRQGDVRWPGAADEISRVHAYYHVDSDGKAFIQDAGSTNGTYINGKRIEANEWVEIKPRDAVTLGKPDLGHHLIFNADNPAVTVQHAIERMDLPEGPLRRPGDYVAPDARVQAQADNQSNFFGQNSELSGRIRDGYVDGGKGTRVGPDALPSRRHKITVDRANDPVLRHVIEDVQKRFGHMTPEEQAFALNRYVHELIGAPHIDGADLDAWHSQFSRDHMGEEILLGEFIRQGKGVCIEQATLLKVLADELGLEATLVRGAGVAGDPTINHAWVHIKLPGSDEPLVFDPRWQEAGVRYSDIISHERGIEIINHGRPIPLEPHAPNGGRIEIIENGNPVRIGEKLRIENGGQEPIGRAHRDSLPPEALNDADISRNHLTISMRDGHLYLRDTSTNGTWVNGRHIQGEEVPINLSDDIRLGRADGYAITLKQEGRPIRVGDGQLRLVEGEQMPVGRNHEGTVNLDNPLSGVASGDHGVLSMRDGQLYFRDTSKNGTWINGKKIIGLEVKVNASDDIRLGSQEGHRLSMSPERSEFHTRTTRGPIDATMDGLIPERSSGTRGPMDADQLDRLRSQIRANNNGYLRTLPFDQQGGLITQTHILDFMDMRLRQLQEAGQIGDEWRVVQTEFHSAADQAGADAFLVNTKTGEAHLLDPTGNLDKASNGSGNNVASLNSDGVVYGRRQFFDEAGVLRTDAEPGATIDFDGRSVPLSQAVSDFQDQVDTVLTSLSSRESPLTLYDFGNSINRTSDRATRLQQIEDIERTIRDRSSEPEFAEYRRDLVQFADNVRDGALRYESSVARQAPPTTYLEDFLSGQSDRVLIDHALESMRVRELDLPHRNPDSNVQVIRKDGTLKLNHPDGTVYDIGPMEGLLRDSQNRLINRDSLKELLLSNPYKGRMKQLRRQFPDLSDDQIVDRVSRALSGIDIRYGLLLGNRDLTHPIRTLERRLAQQDAWQNRIEPPERAVEPVPVRREPESVFSEPSVETRMNDLWHEEGLGSITDMPAGDAHDFLLLLREELRADMRSADLAHLDDLIARFANSDQSAITELTRILSDGS